ncbi:hypothetical protein IGI37_002426 [Enterococcus sp. AZ194]|uniref:alpha/beta fold hydrolase n=1 Tax=Enterococcus sp. AZ194 TaxID=2774629 RepID=UPI003F21FDFA
MKTIFLHGLGQTAESWAAVQQNLPSDFESIYVDLGKLVRGEDVTYESIYTKVYIELEKIEPPFAICGLSLGGMIALNYAIDFPNKVSKLILISTQYKIPQVLFSLQNQVFKLLPANFFQKMSFLKEEVLSLTHSMETLDFSNYLRTIKADTLIIYGQKDQPNKAAAYELRQKITTSSLTMIGDVGHEVNKEAPVQLATCIADHLKVSRNDL